MKIKKIAKMNGNQDGAIFGDLLFRFSSRGKCLVYDIKELEGGDEATELAPISEFLLDKADVIVPHSNAVVFGNEYYKEGDEFPLLYSNVYNNYQKEEDKRVGVLCVYRITRTDGGFTSELVQLIKIGFTYDGALWRSEGDTEDVRPYGNFVIDRERSLLYAFVMRDFNKSTRYFAFELPRLADGAVDAVTGVKALTLNACDIKDRFDTPYHKYVQGACCEGGLIYSLEGFSKTPALRVIDPARGEQIFFFDFLSFDMGVEPEFIDFHGGACIYSDAFGNTYLLDFEGEI